jgi:hypothetical protein
MLKSTGFGGTISAANVSGLGTLATQSGTFSGTSSGINTGDQTLPVGANPSGSVALAAVNGSAMSFLRSDSAPPLSQAIAPIWTGLHTWTPAANAGVPMTVNNDGIHDIADFVGTTGTVQVSLAGNQINFTRNAYNYINANGAAATLVMQVSGASAALNFNTNGALRMTISAAGNVTISGPLGINGASAPAQSTGWGTPTGGAVSSNFAGASATLAQTSAAVAQLITLLKSFGLLGT